MWFPRHDDLVGDALIMTARGFHLEQVRVRIGVIAHTARYIGRVGFVEDPHLQKPQRHPRQDARTR
jgi:hypothetical protein